MFTPIKLYTSKDSALVFGIAMPVWMSFRTGFKPDETYKMNEQFTIVSGEDKSCLHFLCLYFRFRIRSNLIMKEIPYCKRCLLTYGVAWQQVFDSAIL